ncbi:terminase [Cryobacterium sp. Hh11]|uniref:terminase n=1 Tax=Cryobacterium sp. Hh11 TaxID=2555868 RepID=UPI001583E9D6|nr:terminase [Cryobacterium sp. Hh11]
MAAKLLGRTEPRIFTKPLRELTPETSRGFEVIKFALVILGVNLYPWQKFLLIGALEIMPDGQYRFKRVIVLVARQQGKTTLASVLAAWWLFVDSKRHPDMVPPVKFKVVGVAQNLDIAREPWAAVKMWCDPEPNTDEERELALPALQNATAKVSDTNGKEGIYARSRAHYEIRAAANARGKPAARVLMDEMREQKNWTAWNAVSQTLKSFWSGQMWGISNAGDSSAVVLRTQRTAGLESIAEWEEYVEAGIMSAEEFANGHDVTLGLFEWSAPDGCALDDVDAILQANPSIGHGAMTVQSALSDVRGMTEAGYRTEVLCQWVIADVDSFIDVKEYRLRVLPGDEIVIPKGSRTVWGVDVSHDRKTTWLSAAVFTEDGDPFVTVRLSRAGMMWLPDYLAELAEASGQREVAVNAKGCPAMEFIEPLKKLGFTVHEFDGPKYAIATGRYRDAVRDEKLVVIAQPDIDLAVQGGVVVPYADNMAWSRPKSLPIDIAGLIAETIALYALELLKPEPVEATPPPPPQAEMVTRDDVTPSDVNLATANF